jgi:hypothetical protein
MKKMDAGKGKKQRKVMENNSTWKAYEKNEHSQEKEKSHGRASRFQQKRKKYWS